MSINFVLFLAAVLLWFYFRLYFENDFQQVKAKYTDFKTKKVVICATLCHNLEMWKLLVMFAVIKYHMLVF